MKRRLRTSICFFFIIALLCSCNTNISEGYSNTDKTNKETEKRIEESEEKEEITSESPNIISDVEYQIDENELKLALVEQNGELKIQLSASASDYEYGSMILVYFYGIFKELSVDSFNIMVWVGDSNVAVIPTSNGYQIMGTNADGSPTLLMPDWVVEEFTLEQDEIDAFYGELEKIKNDFAKTTEEKLE